MLMIRKIVCLIVVVTLAVGAAFVSGRWPARADDAAAGDPPPEKFAWGFPIAVIDVAAVFKNCEAFEKRMTALKQKLVEKEQEFEREAQEVKDLTEQLKTLDQQDEQYRRLEEEIASRQSSLKIRMAHAKKELMVFEAESYAETYRELQNAVEKYAKAHGIRLVIRYSNDPLNPNKPESVMKAVNRDVVFQGGIDITEEILRWLNDKNVS
jgi:Skp family chaperone for outer membrane proteins